MHAPFIPTVIIQKKRDGQALSSEEIKWFIHGLATGEVADYQAAAFLMAVYLQGMSPAETAALTEAMLHSGRCFKFPASWMPGVIDKHSTGGIGDKASLVLGPIAAAAGVKVPMIAGRGLGHTGGTIDKLESIPGFKVQLSPAAAQRQLKKIGIFILAQTPDLAPADKKLYALRDVTGTVESIPLITASIMSKKLAEGISGLVMDVKTGSGAFMPTLPQAQALANSLAQTAVRCHKNIITYST
ncbi:MAG: thymidine phosphorylase, partial [Bacteriovoracaceae bacterium]|nr:thymidine phosphorylase [Bacteriovoracaceae bacterium]